MPRVHVILTDEEGVLMERTTGGVYGAQAKLIRALLWRFWREQKMVPTKRKSDDDATES